jgi:hypothetical protein
MQALAVGDIRGKSVEGNTEPLMKKNVSKMIAEELTM